MMWETYPGPGEACRAAGEEENLGARGAVNGVEGRKGSFEHLHCSGSGFITVSTLTQILRDGPQWTEY